MAGAPASLADETLLAVRGLHAGYGGSEVLHGVDLEVGAGEVVALLGRNGMGKTTLVRTICGLHPARSGEVVFRGERVEAGAPHRIARRGLGLVPEGRQIFANLTVLEHLSAFERTARTVGSGSAAERIGRVFELFPRLHERRTNLGNQLSGGEQQMLAIGRALVTEPRLLILDEATEGLAPLVRQEIWRCLAALRAERPGDPGDRQVRAAPDPARRPACHPRERPGRVDRHFGRARRRPVDLATPPGSVRTT